MFLSRLLNKAEQNYWPTEMEMAAMVWVVRKCRHLIGSAKVPTIIYTDHGSNTVISQQQCITTSTSTRINLRLVRVSQYLHQFPLQIRHKPGKSNIIPDALSRLPNSDTLSSNSVNTFSNTEAQPGHIITPLLPRDGELYDTGELDLVGAYNFGAYNFGAAIPVMTNEFKQQLIEGYRHDKIRRTYLSI
ncbi:hypothetical protein K3495_g8578 [Podosphaera aphanis]|nr:hypothetical protein K3495_g8578 [Podosphaera aphanis]